MPSRVFAAGLLVPIALFAAGVTIGSWYVPYVVACGARPRFYPEQFGPAAMLALGHGCVNPDTSQSEPLAAFLSVRTDAVTCTELSRMGHLPLTSMQRAFRYLMTTVGWTWRLRGGV